LVAGANCRCQLLFSHLNGPALRPKCDQRAAFAHSSVRSCVTVLVIHFQVKVCVDVSAHALGIELKAGGWRNCHADISVHVRNIDWRYGRFGTHLHSSIAVLDVYFSAHVFKMHALAARLQTKRPGETVRAQVVRLHIELTVEAGKLQIGTRRSEVDALSDSRKLQISPVCSAHRKRAAYVSNVCVVYRTVHADVAADIFCRDSPFSQVDCGVALDLIKIYISI